MVHRLVDHQLVNHKVVYLKKDDYICIINFNSNVLLQTLSLNVGSSQK
jgi:hypothetical protein